MDFFFSFNFSRYNIIRSSIFIPFLSYETFFFSPFLLESKHYSMEILWNLYMYIIKKKKKEKLERIYTSNCWKRIK